MTPLKIGILGAARIAPAAVIEPARATGVAVITALAARDFKRALAFAALHDIPEALTDYETLVTSPSVDAVYIALPPVLHAEWTIRAVAAGKHVLCEKTFAMNAAEAACMAQAARSSDGVVMEAFHYRFYSMFARIKAIVASGAIGDLRSIAARFDVPIAAAAAAQEEIRYNAELGGGALMDLGCYTAHWARSIAEREPDIVEAQTVLDHNGVDLSSHAVLDFGLQLTSQITCSMQLGPSIVLELSGTNGRLTAINLLAPQFGNKIEISANGEFATETCSRRARYHYQLETFAKAVNNRDLINTELDDSIANIKVLDKIKQISGLSA